MSRKHLSLAALGSLVAGIAAAPFMTTATALCVSVMLAAAMLWRCPRQLGLALAIILAFTGGIARYNFDTHIARSDSIDFWNDRPKQTLFTGIVCDEPDVRFTQIKLTVCAEEIIGEPSVRVHGKVLANLPRYPEFAFGETVRVSGRLETPGMIDKFSYQNYLSRFGIYSVAYRAKAEKVSDAKWSWFGELQRFKKWFELRIGEIFPEPHSSFFAGILIGSRKGIPEDVTEKFNITGLTHIVAISGYNITVLVAIMMAMLRGLGKRIAIIASMAAIIIFTIFVGASPAVVRASIMGILGILALHFGRSSNIHITLLAGVAIMLLWNPKILYFDVGFQLSFLSTAGLVYISPLFEKWLEKVPNTLALKESLFLTIAAQIATTPIILLNFERLSLVSPLSNLLIAGPIIPFIMLFGFLAIMISVIWTPLGLIPGFVAYSLLSYILWMVDLTSQVPYATVMIPWFNLALLGIYYLGLAVFLIRKHKQAQCSVI